MYDSAGNAAEEDPSFGGVDLHPGLFVALKGERATLSKEDREERKKKLSSPRVSAIQEREDVAFSKDNRYLLGCSPRGKRAVSTISRRGSRARVSRLERLPPRRVRLLITRPVDFLFILMNAKHTERFVNQLYRRL